MPRPRSRFTAVLEDGHKGPAVVVPFDPTAEWGIAPKPRFSEVYGREMAGHAVRGTLDGHPFEGWVGQRWGRFFVLVDDALRAAAGLRVGRRVEVVLEPAAPARRRSSR